MANSQMYKWRFAIGTTSRVPNEENMHYFIADFDCMVSMEALIFISGSSCVIQATPRGFHLYSDKKLSFDQLIRALKHCGADPSWIRIGRKRGYFFLADKDEVKTSWPVERMILYV